MRYRARYLGRGYWAVTNAQNIEQGWINVFAYATRYPWWWPKENTSTGPGGMKAWLAIGEMLEDIEEWARRKGYAGIEIEACSEKHLKFYTARLTRRGYEVEDDDDGGMPLLVKGL